MKSSSVIGVGLGGAAILGILGWVLLVPDSELETISKRLPVVVAESARLGLPITAAELTGPKPPPEHNAASDFQLFAALAPKDRGFHGPLESAQMSLSQLDPKSASKHLAPFAKCFSPLERAAEKPRLWFSREWDMGPHMLFPEYSTIKDGIKVVCPRARLRALEGDVGGSLADLRRVAKLSELVGQDPSFIAGLTRVGAYGITFEGVRAVAAIWHKHPDRLLALRNQIDGPPLALGLYPGLRGEAFMAATTLRNFGKFGGLAILGVPRKIFGFEVGSRAEPPTPVASELRKDGLPEGDFERANLVQALEYFNRLAEATKDADPSPAELDSAYNLAESHLGNPDALQNTYATTTLPVRFGSYFKAEMHRQVSLAFIDVLLGRPITARDPYDGQLIRYRKTVDGFRVWSVGIDRTNDGGKLRQERVSGEGSDEVVAYPLPKKFPPKPDQRPDYRGADDF